MAHYPVFHQIKCLIFEQLGHRESGAETLGRVVLG